MSALAKGLLIVTVFEPPVYAKINRIAKTTRNARGIEYKGIGIVKKLAIGTIREFQKSTIPDICSKKEIIPNIVEIKPTIFKT